MNLKVLMLNSIDLPFSTILRAFLNLQFILNFLSFSYILEEIQMKSTKCTSESDSFYYSAETSEIQQK